MAKSNSSIALQKKSDALQLARDRVIAAEASVEAAKQEWRLAKEQRTKAKKVARRAKKRFRRSKDELADAQQAVTDAEEILARQTQRAKARRLKVRRKTTLVAVHTAKGKTKPEVNVVSSELEVSPAPESIDNGVSSPAAGTGQNDIRL